MIPQIVIDWWKSPNAQRVKESLIDEGGIFVILLLVALVFGIGSLIKTIIIGLPMNIATVVDKDTGKKYEYARDNGEVSDYVSGNEFDCKDAKPMYNYENENKLKIYLDGKEFLIDNWEIIDKKEIKRKHYCN